MKGESIKTKELREENERLINEMINLKQFEEKNERLMRENIYLASELKALKTDYWTYLQGLFMNAQ